MLPLPSIVLAVTGSQTFSFIFIQSTHTQGWPEPYIHTAYDRVYENFLCLNYR